MAVQLGHKALAEPHDLPIGFALGVEVGTAFGTAHRQAGQAVFKGLLEPEEFHDGQVDRRMEPKAPFIRPDGGVVLHPVAPVDLHLAAVIHPGYPESDDPFRLYQTLYNPGFFQGGAGGNHRLQGS